MLVDIPSLCSRFCLLRIGIIILMLIRTKVVISVPWPLYSVHNLVCLIVNLLCCMQTFVSILFYCFMRFMKYYYSACVLTLTSSYLANIFDLDDWIFDPLKSRFIGIFSLPGMYLGLDVLVN